jgi:hypothetical protein
MRTFIVFVALLSFVGSALWFGLWLKESKKTEVVVGWSHSLVWEAVGGDAPPRFFDTSVDPAPEGRRWNIAGEVDLRDDDGQFNRSPYVLILEQVCGSRDRPECWRLANLEIAGNAVDLLKIPAADEVREEPAQLDASARAAEGNGSGESADSGLEEQVPADGIVEPGLQQAAAPANAQAAAEAEQEAPDPAVSPVAGDRNTVLEIQRRLARLGFNPGLLDGQFGPRTKTAVSNFQKANNLPVDGIPSNELLDRLRAQQ